MIFNIIFNKQGVIIGALQNIESTNQLDISAQVLESFCEYDSKGTKFVKNHNYKSKTVSKRRSLKGDHLANNERINLHVCQKFAHDEHPLSTKAPALSTVKPNVFVTFLINNQEKEFKPDHVILEQNL